MRPEPEKKLLGKALLDAGLITAEQLSSALDEQTAHGGKIGFVLVSLGYLSAEKLSEFLQQATGVGAYQQELPERQKAAAYLPRHLALYYKIAPIKLENKTLTIAVGSLEHPNLLMTLSEVTGLKIDPMVFPEQQIRSFLESSYGLPTSDTGMEVSATGDNVFVVIDTPRRVKALAVSQLKNESDVAEWFRSIIAEAIKEKSRDILIKPDAKNATVFFKHETFYSSQFSIAAPMHDDLSFLLFHLAKLDPLRQRTLQHGRFYVKVHERKILMVVTAIPGVYGIRFLLEMFDERLLKNSYEEMTKSFPDIRAELEAFVTTVRKGMCVITGPEGSGRTSFLYALLGHWKDKFRRIVLLENSIRYPLTGVIQKEVTRADMLSALEQITGDEADLVVIHSIHDAGVAEAACLLAARCAVIAVLQSFDSFLAIDWLCSNQLKPAVKAGLIPFVISPRLVPRICPNCAVPFESSRISTHPVEPILGAHLKMNQGCDTCRNRDHDTAELFFEHLRLDAEAISWIESQHGAIGLREQARKAGRKALYDTVIQDRFNEQLDLLSVMKLHSVLR